MGKIGQIGNKSQRKWVKVGKIGQQMRKNG